MREHERSHVVLQNEQGRLLRTRVERLVKADARLTNGKLSVTVVTSDPGFVGPPPHRHLRNDEAFYIVEGEFTFLVGDETAEVGPGGFVFVPAGTVHSFVNEGQSRGRMLEMFTPADFEGYFEELAQLRAEGSGSRENVEALQAKYGMEVLGPPLERGNA